MVFQHEMQEQSYIDIAKNLNVDVSTVRRILNLFWTTGDVQKRKYPLNAVKASQKLIDVAQLFIINLLLDRPGIFLQEIQTELDEQLGIEVTASCICKFPKKNDFSRQRGCLSFLTRWGLIIDISTAKRTIVFAESH